MYYACFYAIGALLVKNGIETSSHSGARQKFGQLFVKTGKFDRTLAKHYTDLFEKRHKDDYNDFLQYHLFYHRRRFKLEELVLGQCGHDDIIKFGN